jgi:hypothetical protein
MRAATCLQGSNNAAAGAGGTGSGAPQMSLDKQQLARLHGVLGPFMLRRVKKDVVAEMVPKTEVRGCRCVLRHARRVKMMWLCTMQRVGNCVYLGCCVKDVVA